MRTLRRCAAVPAARSTNPRIPLRSAAVLAAAALIVHSGCRSASDNAATVRRPPLVEAVAARSGALPLEEVVSGTVRARNQVAVRPQVAAAVVDVLVRSGEAVAQGQPLVRLEDEELRQRLRQAEADVRLAEATAAEAQARVAELRARVGRSRKLAADELISVQGLETLEAQLAALEAGAEQAAARVEQAEATADERRSALDKAVVRAPVPGRVGQRQVEVGMQVDPGSVLFVVGDLDQMMVEVPLTERMLGHLAAGMPVEIEAGGDGREPIFATLSRISPFLAEDSFTTVGEIDVDNRSGRLQPGMFVSVRILYGASRQATLVPASAVWEDPETGEASLFVVADDGGLALSAAAPEDLDAGEARAIVQRPAQVLAAGDAAVAVAGAREGEWVVVVGQHLLERQRAGETEDGTAARVRASSWERVEGLQALQREDLLAGFLDKQQRIAAALGAEIPASEEVVNRVLQSSTTTTGGG